MGFQIHPLWPQVRRILFHWLLVFVGVFTVGFFVYTEFTAVRLTEQELAEGAARCKDQGLVAYNVGGYPKHKIACTLPRR